MPERELPKEIRKQIENTETQELSPEVLEMVMKKVEDVDTPGLAYTSISWGTRAEKAWKDKKKDLLDYLRLGVLGSKSRQFEGNMTTEERKRLWIRKQRGYFVEYGQGQWQSFPPGKKQQAEDFRKKERQRSWAGKVTPRYRDNLVHFNIVGRAADAKLEKDWDSQKTQISQRGYSIGPNNVTILFDPSPYKEGELIPFLEVTNAELADVPLRTYRPVIYGDIEGKDFIKDKATGDISPRLGAGFVLSSRIKPKLFRGLTITGPYLAGLSESEKNVWPAQLDNSPEVLLAQSKEVVDIMMEAYRDKPEMLLPIYDVNGNLLWPKQLSYEEVKKFVADRHKAKDSASEPNPE